MRKFSFFIKISIWIFSPLRYRYHSRRPCRYMRFESTNILRSNSVSLHNVQNILNINSINKTPKTLAFKIEVDRKIEHIKQQTDCSLHNRVMFIFFPLQDPSRAFGFFHLLITDILIPFLASPRFVSTKISQENPAS